MRRTALVTGGAGFIGSHLVDDLLRDGWRVMVVDNFDRSYDPALKRHNVRAHLDHPAYTCVQEDIRDLDLLRRDLAADYDVIVHLAARVGDRPSTRFPLEYGEVNIIGTHNLLELARECGIKQFVFASTSSVYGLSPNVPWREDDPMLQPINPYGVTKLSSELLGQVYSRMYGLRFIALRLFPVYGPRQRPDLSIPKLARLMLEGRHIPVIGDGSARRDYTFVTDIVRGIRAAMDYDSTPCEIINFGNDQPVSVIEVIHSLEEELGVKARVQYLEEHAEEASQGPASFGKAARLLEYRPTTDLHEGLRIFADWFQANLNLLTAQAPYPELIPDTTTMTLSSSQFSAN